MKDKDQLISETMQQEIYVLLHSF